MATQQHRLAPPLPGGSRDWMWAGMASSAMGVTAGMAGPPVALQALRSGRPVTESRATLAAFFLVIDLAAVRSEEHTSELQSLMRISYAVFCLKKKKKNTTVHTKQSYK